MYLSSTTLSKLLLFLSCPLSSAGFLFAAPPHHPAFTKPASSSTERKAKTFLSVNLSEGESTLSSVQKAKQNDDDGNLPRDLTSIRLSGEKLPNAALDYIENLRSAQTGDCKFSDFIAMLDSCYTAKPISFKNGDLMNNLGENAATAKLLSFAALADLSDDETVLLWCEHYRSVAETPQDTDHQNIRNFMKYGMAGVDMEEVCLTRKKLIVIDGKEGEWEWDEGSYLR